MGFFENLAGFLKGAVGNNRDNAPEDVLTVKRGLSKEGCYDMSKAPEPHGYITKEMDEGIKRFQQDKGLRVDGYLLPGGETEDALRRRPSGAFRTKEKRDTDPQGRFQTTFQWEERNPDKFLTLMSAKNERVEGSTASSDSKPVEHDATGRMIPPGETQRRERIAQREKDTFSGASGNNTLTGAAGNNPLAPGGSNTPNIPVPGKKPLDSPYRPTILKGVDNKAVKEGVLKEEDNILHMYKDTADGGGKVTVGIGLMLPNVEAAKKLPFTVPDGKGGRRPATEQEIEQAFNKVDAIKQPKTGKKHTAKAFDPKEEFGKQYNLDDLQLSEDAADKLLDERLRVDAARLRQVFPDFDTYSPRRQQALLDMQYNLGSTKFQESRIVNGKEEGWPKFFDAVRRGDWKEAARQSERGGIGPKRNEQTKKKLLDGLK